MTGLAAAGGVAAALFERERTGEGQLVSTSLLRIGTYMMGWDTNINLRTGLPTVPLTRTTAPNPLIVGLRGRRREAVLAARARGRPALAGRPAGRRAPRAGRRPRLRRTSSRGRPTRPRSVAELDEVFAKRTRDEWAEVFDREDVWWAPVQATPRAGRRRAGQRGRLLRRGAAPGRHRRHGVASPVDFGSRLGARRASRPSSAQHTEEVLLELGYDWDAIIELKDVGAVLWHRARGGSEATTSPLDSSRPANATRRSTGVGRGGGSTASPKAPEKDGTRV